MKSKVLLSLALVVGYFLGGVPSVSAQVAPMVTVFTASPDTLSYGYSTSLSWNIANGTGNTIYFTCPSTGVKIKKDDGTVFTCNTRQTASTNISDAVGFYIANLTGNTMSIPVRLIPKDSNGADYDAGGMTVVLTVGAVPNPITDFNYATQPGSSVGTPITLNWTGIEVPGANLQFDCKDGITITSTSPSVVDAIKCAQLAYTSDLPASGSVTINFTNSTYSAIDETVRIFPAISPGVYDATHARSVTFTITPKALPLAASITNFTGSRASVISGDNISLSWVANNAPGVNLQIPCGNSLTWSNVQGTTTTPLLCGAPAFSAALPIMGTTTVSIANGSTVAQPLTISVYPQNADGTYDATKVKVINLTIYPAGYVAPVVQTPQVPVALSTTTSTTQVTQSGIAVVRTMTFTVALRAGSRGAQVSALQNFLKQDPSLYPEGKVTGYLGPATVSAIKRLQLRYGLSRPGESAYGTVGPKTRAKLNSMQTF